MAAFSVAGGWILQLVTVTSLVVWLYGLSQYTIASTLASPCTIMRLLERVGNDDFRCSEPLIGDIPPYAILSHTWGSDEVTYRDIMESAGKNKAGYNKLRFIASQAAKDSLKYFWVDTCCIDKSSSAELTEAINSMYRWYQEAAKCYVHLADVSTTSSRQAFRKSRWFTRGWTLQELLAPTLVEFFSADGQRIGTKGSMEGDISGVTGIPTEALRGQALSDYNVSERMAWATDRKTTRKEDEAYCLLGIFGVHLPLIYGEGSNALFRLGEAIEQRSRRTGNYDGLQPGSKAQPAETYNCNTQVNHGHWSVSKSGVFDSMFTGRVKCVRCPKCYWEYTSSKGSYPQPKLAGGRKVPYEVMWQRFHHTKGKESAFRCPSCRDGIMRHWDDMKEHIEEEHTWAEVCGDY